jgi:hypothetical protein
VLLCHGGGQHKKAPGILARAQRFVSARGFAVAAIDAPGHGDRPRTERDQRFTAHIRERIAAGEAVGSLVADYNAALAAQAVPEWQLTLDALQKLAGILTAAAGQLANGSGQWLADVDQGSLASRATQSVHCRAR